jgi:hypothetical protein
MQGLIIGAMVVWLVGMGLSWTEVGTPTHRQHGTKCWPWQPTG